MELKNGYLPPESETVEKIREKRKELKNAGRIHYKDTMKCIKRLERELRDYYRFHAVSNTMGAGGDEKC